MFTLFLRTRLVRSSFQGALCNHPYNVTDEAPAKA
jgi:hypothetical protein